MAQVFKEMEVGKYKKLAYIEVNNYYCKQLLSNQKFMESNS